METKRIRIPLDDKRNIVAEANHDDVPDEMIVYVEDSRTHAVLQDICVVRAKTDLRREKVNPDLLECLLWADADDEDYTHRHVIKTVAAEEYAEINFEAAVDLMDDELREDLHMKLAPCSDQAFFDAYCEAHKQKFGEEFELAKENPCT